MNKDELKNRFDNIPEKYQIALAAAMERMTGLGMVADAFRGADGDERKVAREALDLLVDTAPSRHKKELSTALKNAVERFWTEKDNGMLPVKGETIIAH